MSSSVRSSGFTPLSDRKDTPDNKDFGDTGDCEDVEGARELEDFGDHTLNHFLFRFSLNGPFLDMMPQKWSAGAETANCGHLS